MEGRAFVFLFLLIALRGALDVSSAPTCVIPDYVFKESLLYTTPYLSVVAQPVKTMKTSLFLKPGKDVDRICAYAGIWDDTKKFGTYYHYCKSAADCILHYTSWNLVTVTAEVNDGITLNLKYGACDGKKKIPYNGEGITEMQVRTLGPSEWLNATTSSKWVKNNTTPPDTCPKPTTERPSCLPSSLPSGLRGALNVSSAATCVTPDHVFKETQVYTMIHLDNAPQPVKTMKTSLFVKPGKDYDRICAYAGIWGDTKGITLYGYCFFAAKCNPNYTSWNLVTVTAEVKDDIMLNLKYGTCDGKKKIPSNGEGITGLEVLTRGPSEWLNAATSSKWVTSNTTPPNTCPEPTTESTSCLPSLVPNTTTVSESTAAPHTTTDSGDPEAAHTDLLTVASLSIRCVSMVLKVVLAVEVTVLFYICERQRTSGP